MCLLLCPALVCGLQTASASSSTLGAAVTIKQVIDFCREQDPMSPTFTNDPATETVVTATSSYAALAR